MTEPGANDYMAAEWRPIFAHHGLRCFDDFWARELKLFDRPNTGRGGWSVVARCEWPRPDGVTVATFFKRQENHNTRTWRHPWRGVPTLQREFANVLRCQSCGIPTPVPVYFARRNAGGKWRAILITEELHGFRPLGAFAKEWREERPPVAVRHRVVRATAQLMRQMHQCGLRHNNFYPKHVFLRLDGDTVETRIIDLEKSTWHKSAQACGLADLRTFHRRASGWSRADRLRFLLEYLKVPRLTPAAKKMCARITRP